MSNDRVPVSYKEKALAVTIAVIWVFAGNSTDTDFGNLQ